MEPDPTDPREAGGVLNPAVARAPDGQLYLLPRLVSARNCSRIGLARVRFNRAGEPAGVERLGMALEPSVPYERTPWDGGGVEDPRITCLAWRHLYAMTYTAVGPAGTRIAFALSRDLLHWRRRGLARFAPCAGLDLNQVDNKDGVLFPEPVPAPDGRPALALVHRPVFWPPTAPQSARAVPGGLPPRPSMWISFAPLDELGVSRHLTWGQHRVLIEPHGGWDRLRVGAGAPPLRTSAGWLLLYHGVHGRVLNRVGPQPLVHYDAGVLLLDTAQPWRVLSRTARPLMTPRVAAETTGIVSHVVFPTGLDRHTDGTVDIYYGMADTRIGVARTHLASLLPARGAWSGEAVSDTSGGTARDLPLSRARAGCTSDAVRDPWYWGA
jgi:predicted GH43/DUF377 family glycosyl hydrolase